MSAISTSKERFSFMGDFTDAEEMREKDLENQNNPEWQKDNLEYDLRSTQWILDKARKSDVYAQNLYAAMCNNDFVKNGSEKKWSCSWRYAGGIIAHMQEKGDYIDWYCSGIRNDLTEEEENNLAPEQKIIYAEVKQYVSESEVTQEIKEDLEKLGWSVLTFDMEQLRKKSGENFNEKTKK